MSHINKKINTKSQIYTHKSFDCHLFTLDYSLPCWNGAGEPDDTRSSRGFQKKLREGPLTCFCLISQYWAQFHKIITKTLCRLRTISRCRTSPLHISNWHLPIDGVDILIGKSGRKGLFTDDRQPMDAHSVASLGFAWRFQLVGRHI